MPKYKVGDTVWLRQDLVPYRVYRGEDGTLNACIPGIKGIAAQRQPLTIAYIDGGGYHTADSSWGFVDEMIDEDFTSRAVRKMVENGVAELLRLDPEEKYIIILKNLSVENFRQAQRWIAEECAKAGIKCVVLPEQMFDSLHKMTEVEKESKDGK